MLRVNRESSGSEVNLGREESLDFLDLRVDLDPPVEQDRPAAVVGPDRRANQEIQDLRVFPDRWDPEECRVRMVKTVMGLQDPKVQREILVSLVTPAYQVSTDWKDPKETRDGKGTSDEGETLAGLENQEGKESRDTQDIGATEVLQEAKA